MVSSRSFAIFTHVVSSSLSYRIDLLLFLHMSRFPTPPTVVVESCKHCISVPERT